MNEFYIDRSKGVQIFIDVENGIVKDCHNGKETLNKELNRRYKDKKISHLKKDFEQRMKPAYVCVHSTEINEQRSVVNNIRMKLRLVGSKMNDKDVSEELKKELTLKHDQYLTRLDKEEQKLSMITNKVRNIHKIIL